MESHSETRSFRGGSRAGLGRNPAGGDGPVLAGDRISSDGGIAESSWLPLQFVWVSTAQGDVQGGTSLMWAWQ